MIEKKEFPLIQVNGQTDVIVMDSDSKPVGAFSGLTVDSRLMMKKIDSF